VLIILTAVIRTASVCICALALSLAAAGLAGCFSGDDEPGAADEATNQVAVVVTRLELLTRRRDFKAICDTLFTADAKRRAGGRDCARLLAATGRDVKAPRIQLLSVTLDGEKARARVRTSAQGQAPVEDEIELVRERGGYRISALTS
jgi:hypothetical protein